MRALLRPGETVAQAIDRERRTLRYHSRLDAAQEIEIVLPERHLQRVSLATALLRRVVTVPPIAGERSDATLRRLLDQAERDPAARSALHLKRTTRTPAPA
jgi:hypothetical protein